MTTVVCPACGAEVTDEARRRSFVINREASIGARIIEYEARMSKAPPGIERAMLDFVLDDLRIQLRDVRAELEPAVRAGVSTVNG